MGEIKNIVAASGLRYPLGCVPCLRLPLVSLVPSLYGRSTARFLAGDASARIITQRYCYVVTFVNRVNGIKSLFLSLMSEDIRKEPWMLVFPALTTLLYEDWLPTG